MSIRIRINGEAKTLESSVRVADLLKERGQSTGVAIAVNGEFVPKSQHASRMLQNGDEIEIVAPMQGG